MSIAIYSRKSKFTGKGDSIDNQIELCREYVRFHFPKADPSEIMTFEDEGFSGKTLDRPQFQKLMQMQESKPFDALVVYRLDRVSRNVGDFAKLIEKLNRSGTAFVSIKEQFDTTTSMGRAMMNVSAVFAQLERETIAERVRDNMYLMAKDSCWTGGTTPLGYVSEKVEYNDGGKIRSYFRLSVQESEAAIVQLIFSEYLRTHSCCAVEYYLLEQGFRTRRGVLFDDVAVRRILTNPVYCAVDDVSIDFFQERKCEVVATKEEIGDVGFMPYNRTNQLRAPHPMDKWLVSAGAHKPLISSSDWIRVQKILEGNSGEYFRYAHRNKTKYKPISLLTGVIFCSCGAPMRPKRYTTGGDSFSYICTQRERSRNKLCSIHNCIGKEADAAIRELILTADADENIISRHIKKLRKSEGQVQSYREDLSRNISKTISDKQKQANNLTLSLASGNLDGAALEYVNKSLNTLLEEIEALKHKLMKSAELAAADNSSINEISSAMEYLSTHLESIPLLDRRELIKRIIDKVVWDGERLEVFLATSTNSGTETTDEIITFTDKPVDKPPNPKETDGYYEFRKCSDLVVRAFADSQGIGLRQLAKRCGVSYTTIKYWTSKRNSPSHAQYEAVFMDFYLNTYRNGSE